MSRLVTFMWNGRPYTVNVDREADDPAWDVLRQSLRNAVAAGLSPDDVYHPMSRGEPLALFEIISITHDMS